jgi:peptide/nickel transport system permease protein
MARALRVIHTSEAVPARQAHGARRLQVNLGTAVGGLLLLFLLGGALFAPLLAPFDPARQQLADAFSAPGDGYLLGADHLGRDMLSRLLYGGRATLGAAAAVLAIVVAVGTAAGLVAGYCGGWIDEILMRIVDLALAFPGLILAIAVAGTLGGGMGSVIVSMAAVGWAGYARIVRGMALAVRRREYMTAATALGIPGRRIVAAHMLPNLAGPLIALAAADFGAIIIGIAGLNFLGLGVQPPAPEWGAMLSDAQPFMQTEPWLLIPPAALICAAVLGCHLLGDGLRDHLDPHSARRNGRFPAREDAT